MKLTIRYRVLLPSQGPRRVSSPKVERPLENGHVVISDTFKPHVNDGYALIEKVEIKSGKQLLDSMKILLPEGSVTAILVRSEKSKFSMAWANF